MDKINIDYVFSGTNHMSLRHKKIYDHDIDYVNNRAKLIIRGTDYIKNNINNELKYVNVDYSLLYNAFTEADYLIKFKQHNNYGFSRLYSDSGGLQVSTQNLKLNDDIKNKVYKIQDESDISFCFDNIPIDKVNSDLALCKNHRTQTTLKYFNHNRFYDCAVDTAKNVKHQLSVLKKSKVFYIIQGNSHESMVEWFDIAYDVLGNDISKLYGIALAGICMGNGQIESCDMLFAARKIFNKYPQLPKRLHLLGVGSSKRLLPSILMSRGGFLSPDIIISCDSSTHTMAFSMGKNITLYNVKSTPENSYNQFLGDMNDFYVTHVDDYNESKLFDIIMKYHKNWNGIEDDTYKNNHEYKYICSSIIPLYNVWATKKMLLDVETMIESTGYINLLSHLKNDTDYIKWRAKSFSKLQSKRVAKKRKRLF